MDKRRGKARYDKTGRDMNRGKTLDIEKAQNFIRKDNTLDHTGDYYVPSESEVTICLRLSQISKVF